MTSCAELADCEWLTGPLAAEVLADLAGRGEPLHGATARLRKLFSAARVHLLLEQVELRQRAAAKFEHAAEMFFTRLGLEQATDQWVAAYKAERFADRQSVADFCCGIGGDLLAFAQQGMAIGVDRDPVAACFASANARAAANDISVLTSELADFDASELAAWHIDPDRRSSGNRTTSLEWSNPSLETIDRLLAVAPNAAVKLAPAADVPAEWTERCELEWISRDRQCRQQVAWHGELAQTPGERRATVLSTDGTSLRMVTGQPNQPAPLARQLDRYLFEPDSAVLAAHLTGSVAAEHGLSLVSAGIAYLTGPSTIEDPALACFAVDEVLPLDVRQLAGHLRGRNIGQLEIKKRGVDHDPATVRKQLRLTGDEAATLFLTKLNGKHAAIVARRIEQTQQASSLSPAS